MCVWMALPVVVAICTTLTNLTNIYTEQPQHTLVMNILVISLQAAATLIGINWLKFNFSTFFLFYKRSSLYPRTDSRQKGGVSVLPELAELTRWKRQCNNSFSLLHKSALLCRSLLPLARCVHCIQLRKRSLDSSNKLVVTLTLMPISLSLSAICCVIVTYYE